MPISTSNKGKISLFLRAMNTKTTVTIDFSVRKAKSKHYDLIATKLTAGTEEPSAQTIESCVLR